MFIVCSFLKQAAFHMAILPICMLVMFVAAILAMIRNKKRVVLQRVGHFAVTTIFLLYPGIVTRVFTTLKCKTIGDKQYLMADYSVVSFFSHFLRLALSFLCTGLFSHILSFFSHIVFFFLLATAGMLGR